VTHVTRIHSFPILSLLSLSTLRILKLRHATMTSLFRRSPAAGSALSCGQIRLLCPPSTAAVRYGYSPRRPRIELRLAKPPCAAKYGGAWARSGLEEEGEKAGPRLCAVEEFAPESGRKSVNRSAEVIIAAAVTVVMGVGNRVLYKLALVPLKNYPFFLAQLATVGYFILLNVCVSLF